MLAPPPILVKNPEKDTDDGENVLDRPRATHWWFRGRKYGHFEIIELDS